MRKLKVEISGGNIKKAPLYAKYSGRFEPQEAYLSFSYSDKFRDTVEVFADYSGEVGNAVPSDVYEGKTIRIPTSPYVSREWLEDLPTNDVAIRHINDMFDLEGDEAIDAEWQAKCFFANDVEHVEVWESLDWIQEILSINEDNTKAVVGYCGDLKVVIVASDARNEERVKYLAGLLEEMCDEVGDDQALNFEWTDLVVEIAELLVDPD